MDPHLYKAAQDGNLFVIKQFESQLYTQHTPNGNTVLHVVADFCKSSSAVEEILKREPDLLLKLNSQGETALHIAARKGHYNVIRVLIDCANQYHHREYSSAFRDTNKIWIQDDTSLVHLPNNANESPLYLAVEKGYHVIAAMMLSTCKSPSSSLSNFVDDGGQGSRTALHAAARRNFPECVELILENLPSQTKRVDEFGWTPLHYAARFNHQGVAKQLLLADRFMAYVKSKPIAIVEDSGKTALHIAVTHGHMQMIEEILSHCPDCWEMVTNQGKNVIHLAVENEQKEVFDFILQKSWAFDLINQKDIDGNPPLHLYAATKNLPGDNLLDHPEVDKNALNNAGLTPLDLIRGGAHLVGERKDSITSELKKVGTTQELQNVITIEKALEEPKSDKPQKSPKKERTASKSDKLQELERMGETYLVVATLIITISFTAGFTIPGGYEGSESPRKGMAILAKKPAFLAFIVFDALAMMSSVGVVAILLLLPKSNRRTRLSFHQHCKFYIAFALLLLGISFVTGLYVSIPVRGIRIFLLVLLYPVGMFVFGYAFPSLGIISEILSR